MAKCELSVADRLAIQELLAAYSWALDTGDTEEFIKLFTADARMVEQVFEEPDVWEGHEGLRKLCAHYFNVPNFPGRQHHVSQSVFSGGGDRVAVKSFVFVTECQGEPPYIVRFAGWYGDVVVKEADGEWRFKLRTVRLWDGPVLKNFPGRGQWVPRQRPTELKIKR